MAGLGMREMAERARKAARVLATVDEEAKKEALIKAAELLVSRAPEIEAENSRDLAEGEKAGLSGAMLDRLGLDGKRIQRMAEGVRQVAHLADPVGEVMKETVRPNGLVIRKVRVPIGVVAIIYESRPNVTADAGSLCLRSGNACILRGGKEAVRSNLAIGRVMAEAVSGAGLPREAIQVVSTTDRAAVGELLKLDGLIDVVIPRGGEGLIRRVAKESRIPVIKHYKGVCHVYVHPSADRGMAMKIVMNAKTQRPGVCNAMETLLVDGGIAAEFLPAVAKSLEEAGVMMFGDERARKLCPGMKEATEDSWTTEYLDLKLSVRVVDGLKQAIEHINSYGSAHSDAIVAADRAAAERFLAEVDSACVFHNTTTRFSDGYEFGMGAEIGISTDKLHARGPMALEELTTYKWLVYGSGQLRT